MCLAPNLVSVGINQLEIEDRRDVFGLDSRILGGSYDVSHIFSHGGALNHILDTKLLLRWFITRNLPLYWKTSKANEAD
jgi:hypothetical protein